MNTILVACFVLALVLGLISPVQAAPMPTVGESARGIPVAYEVDVVVVGGSSGAVSAAEAAAKAGAKVFLAAPRPYLGEDMCATLRPWLEEGETPASPLAQRIFSAEAEPSPIAVNPNQYLFQYEADQPSVDRHKDTVPPKRLNDGEWVKPETDSVEYNNDVTVVCDLGGPQDVKDVTVLPFYREGGDFNSESVTISTSDDKKAWKEVGTFKCDRVQGPVALVTTPINAKVRYLRFFIKKASDAKRILVGEIRITKPDSAVAAAPPPAPEPPKSFVRLAKPLHVKRMLDQALLAAKVDWLTGTYATDVLRDEAGNLCGIVMANRTGRQAVLAKVIIDASDRAWLARTAGAQFAPYPAGPQTFRRTVVGGEPVSGPGVEGRKVGLSFSAGQKTYDVYEYTLRLPMADGSFASFARADQAARDKTFHLAQADASEVLFQVPPDPMKGKATAGPWAGADKVPLDAFRPATVEQLYIVGGCADMPREAAEKLVRPLALIDVGARIGAAAAAEAKALPAPKMAKVAGAAKPLAPAAPGDTKELLTGIRPTGVDVKATVASPDRGVPVLGKYDAVVVGAGTGGAPAGIGAARNGARTLVLEYLHGMGGVETMGMIIKYYHGYRGGFTAEIDAGVKALGAPNEVIAKNEWFRRENRKAGAEIWYGVLGCGAFVQNGVVKGVIVTTPQGRGVVLAKTVIDATGNSDIAAAAGAQTDYTGADNVGVQGAGLPPINLGAAYTNTDYTFADDTDVMDFWHLFVAAREKFKNAYDLGQLVDTRERRRIVGDVTLSPMDMMLNRTWPDTFSMHKSNFDSHGFTVHPIFLLKPPGKDSITVFVPFRALLPKGLDGILVTGLGVSAHRDAIPVIRMQPDVQNQGYAAGTAAAMVAPSAGAIRSVDLRGLQKHLVEKGCLPESVLSDRDSFPLPKERVAQAVKNLCQEHADLAVVLAQPKDSVPLLKQAYAAAKTDDEKLAYAHVLGMMGDPTGAAALIAKVEAAETFDKGWNFVGMGQFGMSISPLDSYIVALGRTRDPKAVDVILKKVALLDATKEFSHHRACAMALEAIGDPRAAKPLADLLSKPGMTGYATTTVQEAEQKSIVGGGTETKPRNESLRELVVARALYRCGDSGGLGKKILEQYAKDLRGHYARHAQAVLAEKKQ
jgi:flavin-dependent dehydrogenase